MLATEITRFRRRLKGWVRDQFGRRKRRSARASQQLYWTISLPFFSIPGEGTVRITMPPSESQTVEVDDLEASVQLCFRRDVPGNGLVVLERIDHGINSIDDPLLVEELKRRNTCLTVCPVWRSSDPGPQDVDRIKEMYELGRLVTLNTDDPAEFDSGYLTDMLVGVQEASGYSTQDLVRLMLNAFEGCWLSRSAKDIYIESLLKYAAAHGVSRP